MCSRQGGGTSIGHGAVGGDGAIGGGLAGLQTSGKVVGWVMVQTAQVCEGTLKMKTLLKLVLSLRY